MIIDMISEMLDGMDGELIRMHADNITEIRLRTEQRIRADCLDGRELVGGQLSRMRFHEILNRLMGNSMYACETELRQGYFTTIDGCRVGVCGKLNAGKNGIDSLANIASACIRIPREICGCADKLTELARKSKAPGLLIVSPPGKGKTTLLRDYIRQLSDGGLNIGLADERREIAGCLEGIPQLDVGCRTDVMDNCPKSMGLTMLIRSCSPDLVAADEIGSDEDVEAIRFARCSGVHVAATIHGSSLDDVRRKRHTAALLEEGIFDRCAVLGPECGKISKIYSLQACAGDRGNDVQRSDAGNGPACVHLYGKDDVIRPQEEK